MAYRKAMNSALDIILEREITEYPIFIAHQDTFDAGIPIIKRHEVNGNWNINVSTLEEFIQRKSFNQIKSMRLKQPLNHRKIIFAFCIK